MSFFFFFGKKTSYELVEYISINVKYNEITNMIHIYIYIYTHTHTNYYILRGISVVQNASIS